MGLAGGAVTTAGLLDRASRAVAARRDVVRAAERAGDEARVQRVTVVAGILSVVALFSGVFFGFFGSNASPVMADSRPFLSPIYLSFYIVLATILALVVLMFVLIRRRFPLRTDSQELAVWGIVRQADKSDGQE